MQLKGCLRQMKHIQYSCSIHQTTACVKFFKNGTVLEKL